MKKSAALLTQQEILDQRNSDAVVWGSTHPSFMNLVDRLICDVSEKSIPEPEKGKILLKIREVGHMLQKYN